MELCGKVKAEIKFSGTAPSAKERTNFMPILRIYYGTASTAEEKETSQCF